MTKNTAQFERYFFDQIICKPGSVESLFQPIRSAKTAGPRCRISVSLVAISTDMPSQLSKIPPSWLQLFCF